MDNKRILIWASSYAPVLGGLQRMLEQLAHEWQRQGLTVLVLTNKYPYQLKSKEKVNDINVKRLIHFSDQGKGVKSFLYKCLIPFQTKSITSLIKAFNPDKVYVQFPSAQLPYLEHVYKTIPNKQWYLNFHGHDILKHFEVDEQYSYTKLLNSANLQRLQAFAQNQSITLTACSQWLANRVEQVFSRSCLVIHNAVDLTAFSSYGERPIKDSYIFAFGRLEEHKGFQILINAYQKAISSLSNAPKLIIAGSGPFEKQLKTIVDLDYKDQILFVGKLVAKDLANYGHYAESIWIPSLREPFGIAVLEALAMNPNVYASNVGGIPEAGADYIQYFVPKVKDIELSLISSESNSFLCEIDETVKTYLYGFNVKKMTQNYLKVYNH